MLGSFFKIEHLMYMLMNHDLAPNSLELHQGRRVCGYFTTGKTGATVQLIFAASLLCRAHRKIRTAKNCDTAKTGTSAQQRNSARQRIGQRMAMDPARQGTNPAHGKGLMHTARALGIAVPHPLPCAQLGCTAKPGATTQGRRMATRATHISV
jgi:hypothetical protein